MPSNAFSIHLKQLLIDADELDDIHTQLKTGNPGRQYGIASLNRAAVVMSVSAWEAYVEELVRESVRVLQPPVSTNGIWSVLNEYAEAQIKRFNTPDVQNVERLIYNCLGLKEVRSSWNWQNCTSEQALIRLGDAMVTRHKIAHGVNPRPTVHNHYAASLGEFFRKLARCTDDTVRAHLTAVHKVLKPWPE